MISCLVIAFAMLQFFMPHQENHRIIVFFGVAAFIVPYFLSIFFGYRRVCNNRREMIVDYADYQRSVFRSISIGCLVLFFYMAFLFYSFFDVIFFFEDPFLIRSSLIAYLFFLIKIIQWGFDSWSLSKISSFET
jgi:hypothetical protein